MSSYDERDRRPDEEDDGRTIADMSDLDRPNPFSFAVGELRKEEQQMYPPSNSSWQEVDLTRRERLLMIAGALKATLLIALAYIVGLAAVVWLLLWLWR